MSQASTDTHRTPPRTTTRMHRTSPASARGSPTAWAQDTDTPGHSNCSLDRTATWRRSCTLLHGRRRTSTSRIRGHTSSCRHSLCSRRRCTALCMRAVQPHTLGHPHMQARRAAQPRRQLRHAQGVLEVVRPRPSTGVRVCSVATPMILTVGQPAPHQPHQP
jgi:hypothetical protein